MEVGNLSSREIEPDRAVADLFSHYGGGQQSRESGAEAVVEQAQHIGIALSAPSRHGLHLDPSTVSTSGCTIAGDAG
jgi:hypothetical protein